MTLFAEVCRFADDIIPPLLHIGYPIDAIPVFLCTLYLVPLYIHIVADGDWISGTDTTNAEVAFDTALHIRTIVQTDDVTATR